MSLLYQRSGRFKLFAPHQETENPNLKVFFNIQFNRASSPNANIENISRFGCSYTLGLTADTCNEKKYQSLFTDYLIITLTVTLNQLSNLWFTVLESTPAHWSKCIYRVYREFRRFLVCHKKFLNLLKLVKCNIYFRLKIDFPFHIYKRVVNTNLKQHLLLDQGNDMD